METSISLRPYLHEGVNVVNADAFKKNRSMYHEAVMQLVDELGNESSHEQAMLRPITSVAAVRKMINDNEDTRIYVLYSYARDRVLGFVRLSTRPVPMDANRAPERTYCLVDMWVHPTARQAGNGQKMFKFACHDVNKQPNELAYPRLTPPLEQMLSRKFHLYANRAQQVAGFTLFNLPAPSTPVANSDDGFHSNPMSSAGSGKNSPDSMSVSSASSSGGNKVDRSAVTNGHHQLNGHHPTSVQPQLSRLHSTSAENPITEQYSGRSNGVVVDATDGGVVGGGKRKGDHTLSGIRNQHYHSSITF